MARLAGLKPAQRGWSSRERAGQSLTQAMGLRGKEGEAAGLCSCLGDWGHHRRSKVREGPLSGSVFAFKSLQGSLQAEDIVLSCVARGGTDSPKNNREANGNKLLVEEMRSPLLKVCK